METKGNHSDVAVDIAGSKRLKLDDALSEIGHGKFHYILLFVNGFSLSGMIFELYSTSYLLPAAQCDFQMTSEQKGLLNSISYIGVIAGCYMWGFIADTKGRKTALIYSLGSDFICSVISSFAPNYYVFLVFRFFNGFFVFCAGAVIFAFTGEFHGVRTRSTAVVLLGTFQAAAILVLPGLAWLIIPQNWNFDLPDYNYNSWRIFVVFCGVPSLLCCLIMIFFIPESPKFLLNQGRVHETIEVLRRMYTINTGNSAESYQVKDLEYEESSDKSQKENSNVVLNAIQSIWNQTVPLFHKPHLFYTILVCVLQFGIFSSFNSLILWLPEVFNRMAEYVQQNPGQYATVCESLNWRPKLQVSNNIEYDIRASTSIDNISSSMINTTYSPDDYNTDFGFDSLMCDNSINLETFKNNLILGSPGVFVALLMGYLVNFGKKMFICIFMLVASVCAISLYFVNTSDGVLALACAFVTLTGGSSTFVVACVIDLFPTSFRAMATSLSLMCGRMGVIFGNMMIGALIDISCDTVFFVLSGVVFVGACLSCLLPTSHRDVKSSTSER